MKKIFITTISTTTLLIGGFLYIVPTQVFAQTLINKATTYTLLAPLPVIPGVQQDSGCVSGNTLTCISFNTFIQYAFKFAIALAIFLAIVMIIYNGFRWMMSESSFTKVSEAKEGITNAVLGLLGALACYLILLTIDPRLVQINTSIPPITVAGCNLNQSTNQIVCTGTTALQSQINANLNQLNSTDAATVQNLQNQNTAAQARIAQINATMSQPGYVPDPALQTELTNLQQTVKANNSQSAQVVASGTSLNYVNNIVSVLSTTATDNYGNFDSDTRQAVTDAENAINTAYTQALSDPNVASDPAAIQKLQFQQSFLTDQVNKEQQWDSLVANMDNFYRKTGPLAFDTAGFSSLYNTYVSQENALNSGTPSTDPTLSKIQADPVLLAQYQSMLNNRLSKADQIITKDQITLTTPKTP